MMHCAWTTGCQARLLKVATVLQHPFLLLIRVYWGWQFFQAGSGKFGKVAEVAGFFGGMGIPFPTLSVYLVATTETVGGLLLLVGLWTRVATIPLIITMCVAFATAHRDGLLNMCHDPDAFFAEAPFLFLYAAVILFLFGPGKLSADGVAGKAKKLTGKGERP